jgi:phosphate:Na+ symporter
MQDFIFGLIGGTALLMYGVDMMGDGLEKASGRIMQKVLTVLTGRVWSAFLVGIVTTVLVQSSTAITVLTVGFVNAGLMKLSQAIGIIYGANIGTTITAQLMAFSFKFKLTEIALPVLGIGFAINYFAKKETLKHIGSAIMGFGIMFLGLKILNGGIPYIKESEGIKHFFQNYASITIIGIILGAVATALVHSSSATVGLVLMLGQAGVIDLPGAIAIMLGDNIGTCITAQLASMTGNINARRTAWAHTLYNIIGVLVCAILLKPFIYVIESTTLFFNNSTDIGLQIANSHTVFNVLSAFIFLPINKYYVRFLETIIRDKSVEKNVPLDKLLINTPIAAFKATLEEIIKALGLTKSMINSSMDAFYTSESKKLTTVRSNEEVLNSIQKDITAYIVELSKHSLTESHSHMVPAFINSINNIERAGDHTMEYMNYITTKINKNLPFSDDSLQELKNLENIITEMIDITVRSIQSKDNSQTNRVKELEALSDEYYEKALAGHLKRLEQGDCNIESGMIFVDMVTHMERIADHIFKVYMIIVAEDIIVNFV